MRSSVVGKEMLECPLVIVIVYFSFLSFVLLFSSFVVFILHLLVGRDCSTLIRESMNQSE
jgi:hypothetical protein